VNYVWGKGVARPFAQLRGKRLVGKGKRALDILGLKRLVGLVEEALDGPQTVLLSGGELGRVDLAQALLGAVKTLLRIGAEPLLVRGAQHG
jgi:hypothetical protein